MKLREIAGRIDRHLMRFASDKELSKYESGKTQFWNPGAIASGRYVMVSYVSYQGHSSLSKQEAIDYLSWLDSGKVGRHFEQQRDVAA